MASEKKPPHTTSHLKESGYDVKAHQWLESTYWMSQYQFYLHCLLTSHNLVSLTQGNKPEDTKNNQPDNVGGRTTQRNTATNIIGYEVYTASFLRRVIAELVDFIILILILTFTTKGFDIRIPEDALLQINFEELPLEVLQEVEVLLFVFLGSLLSLHAVKWLMEAVMVSLFCTTPGKWLCGLRVLHCEKYTRSNSHLPFAVRVEPGGNVPLKWSILRATIKAAIATCTPILLLLMFTRSGRLKYDELSRSAVVHVTILCKPIFRNTTQNNNNH